MLPSPHTIPPHPQVEDLGVLDEIARIVSEGEVETEFSKAFSTQKMSTPSSMMKRWTGVETEVEKFLKRINELYRTSVASKSKNIGSINLSELVKQMKMLL